ncbi:helix-turn-helix domain-containing protein [Undibacterium curvum]|uniref:helix-turn-helix domain-containing protein n=1 Tax=Undibacterium curvum TaxID=2762294 RepID=UPI003D0DFE6D
MNAINKKEAVDKRNIVCTAVGKNLKKLRIAANKSQETLAFDAEVDRTYISQIERGVGNPSILTLANLCYALDITLSDLFEPVKIALKPDGVARRVNPSKTIQKPAKSRLR